MIRKLYDNYKIYHPDGTLMFLCSEKKFNWYLNRNLSKIIENNGAILTFIPAGHGANSYDKAGLCERNNNCVVCFEEKNLTYHHIFPYMYKKLIDTKIKEHNSYDVLPVCEDCHRIYEKEANIFKNILQETHCNKEDSYDEFYLNDAIKAINTLDNYGHLIPEERKLQLNEIILLAENRFNVYRTELPNLVLPKTAQKVLDKVGIHNLIIAFRIHFINTMTPKYLPEYFEIYDLSMYKIQN